MVAERRWHPSQEIIEQKGEDGAIELRLRLRGLEEVARCGDQLWVTHCDDRRVMVGVGSFRERLMQQR